jgi:hypothetical protein
VHDLTPTERDRLHHMSQGDLLEQSFVNRRRFYPIETVPVTPRSPSERAHRV